MVHKLAVFSLVSVALILSVSPAAGQSARLDQILETPPAPETAPATTPTEPSTPEGPATASAPSPGADLSQWGWQPQVWDGGTISMGTTAEGFLMQGRPFPERGPGWELFPETIERKCFYATDELLAAIQRAAAAVAESHGGPPLVVANSSLEYGGAIPWSQSHRAGRDVDLLFYQFDAAGEPVKAEAFVSFHCDGTANEGALKLDAERNWALVKALLTDEAAPIQLIFVSGCVKRRILAAAEKDGASPELLAKARELLWRPRDSRSHDDHFHVRFYCSEDDLLAGCEDAGRYWEGVPTSPQARLERARALVDELRKGAVEVRRRAARAIGRLGFAQVAHRLPAALNDADPEVRANAGVSIALLDSEATYGHLAARLKPPTDLDRFEQGLGILAQVHSKGSAWRFEQILQGTYEPLTTLKPDAEQLRRLRRLAARGLMMVARYRSVPKLIDCLEDSDGELRSIALAALRRFTNQRPAAELSEPKAVADRWRTWWRANRKGKHARWLVRGFRAAGYQVRYPVWNWEAVPGLLEAVGHGDEVGWNAHTLLARFSRGPTPAYHPDGAVRTQRWTAWWWGGHRWRARKASR